MYLKKDSNETCKKKTCRYTTHQSKKMAPALHLLQGFISPLALFLLRKMKC